MNKSQKRKVYFGLGAITLIILLGIVFYYSTSESVITIGGQEYKETQTFNLNNADIIVETPRFGETKSGMSINNIIADVNGDNDGEVVITSYFQENQNNFNAKISASSYNRGGTNYQKGTITFFKSGTVTTICKNSGHVDRDNGENTAICKIGSEQLKLTINSDIANQGADKSNQETFTFNVDNGDKIDYQLNVALYSIKSMSAYSELDLTFTPSQEDIQEDQNNNIEDDKRDNLQEVECNANIDCQDICGTKVPTCQSGACYCGGEQVFEEKIDKISYLYYLIPIILLSLIIWIAYLKFRKKRR